MKRLACFLLLLLTAADPVRAQPRTVSVTLVLSLVLTQPMIARLWQLPWLPCSIPRNGNGTCAPF
jgi:hypothetical protein